VKRLVDFAFLSVLFVLSIPGMIIAMLWITLEYIRDELKKLCIENKND
jgi:lipopolysaccharide/colanic/teichoic acid biosynthesis glycosyltransferase